VAVDPIHRRFALPLNIAQFEGVKNFYVDTLELPLLEESTQKMSISVGEPVLTFIHSKDFDSPYYHFAFNITENNKEKALQ
jgi:catechol-2,3-dioxygenase